MLSKKKKNYDQVSCFQRFQRIFDFSPKTPTLKMHSYIWKFPLSALDSALIDENTLVLYPVPVTVITCLIYMFLFFDETIYSFGECRGNGLGQERNSDLQGIPFRFYSLGGDR